MNRQTFDKLCEQDKEWERFKKVCLEDENDALLCDRLVERLPENVMKFAFRQWKEEGKILKEEIFKEEPVKLERITIEEAAKSLNRPIPFWWPEL